MDDQIRLLDTLSCLLNSMCMGAWIYPDPESLDPSLYYAKQKHPLPFYFRLQDPILVLMYRCEFTEARQEQVINIVKMPCQCGSDKE